MKLKLLFILIFILFLFSRLYHLSSVPNGLYTDEAAFGYNAYSLLTTGRDEFGKMVPLVFQSFGDFKSPLFFYYLIPFVGIFGLNIFSIRLGAVVLSLGILIGIYVLSYILTDKKRISLLSAFAYTVLPFSLIFNRMVHENNLSLFLIIWSLVLLIKKPKQMFYLVLSGLFLGLATYSYHDARVTVPLILGGIFLLFLKQKTKLNNFIIVLLPVLSLFFFLIFSTRSGSAFHRPLSVLVFSDVGVMADIIAFRQDVTFFKNKDITFATSVFVNKPMNYLSAVLSHYFSHFSPDFLLFHGDMVHIYSLVGSGVILLSLFPFILLGLMSLRYWNTKSRLVLLYFFLISPIAGTLTKYVPSASRNILMTIPLSIVIGSGLYYFSLKLNSRYKNIFLSILVFSFFTLIFSFDYGRILNSYFFITPIRYARDWNYGREELLNNVRQMENRYKTIWFTRQVGEYIYPLFYFKYPPSLFAADHTFHEVDQYGFMWVKGFGKYVFDTLPDNPDLHKDILYIGVPDNFDSAVKPLKILYYPTGEAAYYILDATSFPKRYAN